MSNWPKVVKSIETTTFKVSTNFGHGTGFIVQAFNERFTVATAWHVIEKLATIKDKYARYVKLHSADGATIIEANAIGTARLGPDGCDIGIVWIGNPFNSEGVNELIIALNKTGIIGGELDVSGGGGVLNISGGRTEFLPEAIPALLTRKEVVKGMELGWIGYPSLASDSPCFFSGRLSGYRQSPFAYLIDGTGIPGLSGGPVFDNAGRIIGIVSQYLGPDRITSAGIMAAAPIDNVDNLCSKY
jgi:hypothetical protein